MENIITSTFIKGGIKLNTNKNFAIKGKCIPYLITNTADYMIIHDGISQEEFEQILDNNYGLYQKVSQVIGLKQSLFLLFHTTGLCQSNHDALIDLKKQIIEELKNKYSYEFDEEWFEQMIKEDFKTNV